MMNTTSPKESCFGKREWEREKQIQQISTNPSKEGTRTLSRICYSNCKIYLSRSSILGCHSGLKEGQRNNATDCDKNHCKQWCYHLMHQHPSCPALNRWKTRWYLHAVIIGFALQHWNECLRDRQEEHCNEIRSDLIQDFERPGDRELLLREWVRHVHDIEDDQQDHEV